MLFVAIDCIAERSRNPTYLSVGPGKKSGHPPLRNAPATVAPPGRNSEPPQSRANQRNSIMKGGTGALGHSGFLLKDVLPEELVAGIRTVAEGESLLAPTAITRLIASFRERQIYRPIPPKMENLTPREREIFGLLARENSDAQIAAQLALTRATVKTYVTRILTKLGLTDRVQAVVLGYETGMVRPGDSS
jgi:DNA-binding CsgD family transcriptional regulator